MPGATRILLVENFTRMAPWISRRQCTRATNLGVLFTTMYALARLRFKPTSACLRSVRLPSRLLLWGCQRSASLLRQLCQRHLSLPTAFLSLCGDSASLLVFPACLGGRNISRLLIVIQCN